jgi:urease subunit gamma/beta
MHLTPREHERLLLAAGADLARRRLARGAILGSVEAIALVCDEVQEMAWDGIPLAKIIERAKVVVPAGSLIPGAASLVPHIQIEALFPHGTVLVHIDEPFGPADVDGPGSIRTATERITLAPGRLRTTAALHNTGALPVWISSHMPLSHVNGAVRVSLDSPGDYRLDVPAGAARKIESGEQVVLAVVRIVRGET